eukprot:CAMPEP_0198329182 /NCGR_PEP_ID=MMETSP1450-20131203/16006_1 /TAXON_ID=753684 ORGANISM="Madagascaria erythrocladiodes, Strain CCMP3234" /NCGR_SAMPLE_ID=MMETSP1450 /ASSEMBLY_ACC=CAM_ASM_001115 /LENGTH=85 /DNA_ID=CAMNT_0044033377 /DNA_START=47 /DNA_END=300 /DNA_ORIENTATION=-
MTFDTSDAKIQVDMTLAAPPEHDDAPPFGGVATGHDLYLSGGAPGQGGPKQMYAGMPEPTAGATAPYEHAPRERMTMYAGMPEPT